MVTREHTQAGRVRRLTVVRGAVGWEAREEHDSHVVRETRYTDWHRVERAIRAFDLQNLAERYSANR